MTDTPSWRPPFAAQGEYVIDADLVPVARAIEPGAARAAAIADALNAHYGPWQPPEDRPEEYRCLGWYWGSWRPVHWEENRWRIPGRLGFVRPSAFRPMPPPPGEGEVE